MRSLHEAFEHYHKQSHLGRLEEALANIDSIANEFSRMGTAVEPFSLHQSVVEMAKRQGMYGIAEIPDLGLSAASQFDVAADATHMSLLPATQTVSAGQLMREEARRLSEGVLGRQYSQLAAQAAAHIPSLSAPLDLYRCQELDEGLLANRVFPISQSALWGASEMDQVAARIGMVSSSAEALRIQAGLQHQLLGTAVFDQAYELAQAAQQYHLDDYLDQFKTSVGPLTDKMLYLNSLESIRSEEHLRSFVQASTVADVLGHSHGFGFEAQQALAILSQQTIPQFASVQEYGHVLKAAGIALPRWPRLQLLTIAERRKRLRKLRGVNKGSKHRKEAWTVFDRNEQILREIIDAAMTDHYGEDWPLERLERCGCQRLLSRWMAHGGDVLDHADFGHYIYIMCDEEHFEAVFSIGFGELEGLKGLLTKAKSLRIPVMHAQSFTKEDLRDVRTTWKAIEAGLLGLTSEYEVVYH